MLGNFRTLFHAPGTEGHVNQGSLLSFRSDQASVIIQVLLP